MAEVDVHVYSLYYVVVVNCTDLRLSFGLGSRTRLQNALLVCHTCRASFVGGAATAALILTRTPSAVGA